MNKILFIFLILLSISQKIFAQGSSSCFDGDVPVVVQFYFTQFSSGEVSWDIQDSDGTIYAQNPFPPVANFEYTSDEVCLTPGETYTFNAYDAGGDGWGADSWYQLSICGGGNILANNNGNAPLGDGASEDFTISLSYDNCYCFSAQVSQQSASSATSSNGSLFTSVSGGTPPYSYSWSNGATTQNLNNVSPGVYVLTIEDFLGCSEIVIAEVQGPNIYMSPIDHTVCTGIFYDSGGSLDNFESNENYTMTFCNGDPNLSSSLDFSFFDLGGSFFSSPTFFIYDGTSTSNNVLYSYTGPGDSPPGNITASDANPSGCLTVSFTSPFLEAPGWAAEINCVYPCQDFTVEIESSDLINELGQIEACHDIDLNVVTNYPENDTYYNQQDLTTSFEWVFGDDQSASGQSITHLYSDLGQYELTLVATDINGCTAETNITVIKESPGIITSIVPPEETEVCPETIVQVGSGSNSSTSFFQTLNYYLYDEVINVGEDFGDPIYLPDGSGVSYETEVLVDSFDPTAILDDDDFVEICAEIEHSYLGDLDMSLTAPNGTEVSLFTQVGGSTWLGNAIDNDATQISGDCWEYCWSIDPDFGTFASSIDNTMDAPLGGNSMIPGSYAPLGNFSDFEGSSANGTWTLTITDNLAIDNGFICSWGITLNVVAEDDEVTVDSLVAEVISFNWYCEEEPSSIITYDSTMITVQPLLSGPHNYVLTLLDNFGCEYTEEFELDVYSSPITAPDFVSECQDQFDLSVSNLPPGGGSWALIDSPDESQVSFDPDTNSLTPQITVGEIGSYVFQFTDNDCQLSDKITVDVEVVNPIIDPPADILCALDNTISVVDPTGNGGVWTVFSADTSHNAILSDYSSLETSITVDDFGTYEMVFTVDFCYGTDTMDVNFITVDPYIYDPGVQVCDWDVELQVNNPSSTGGFWQIINQPNHTSAFFSSLDELDLVMEVDDFGIYEMAYTINGCETTDILNVNFGQAIPQISTEELVLCDLITEVQVESYGMDEGWEVIDGPGSAMFSNPFVFETNFVVDTYGDYTLAYTGCDTMVVFNVLFMCDLAIPNIVSTSNEEWPNNVLFIEGLTEEFYSYSNMSIFDRWGNEVYRNGYYGLDDTWWDGQNTHKNDELAEGVYFYILKVGNKITMEEKTYKGSVHVFH